MVISKDGAGFLYFNFLEKGGRKLLEFLHRELGNTKGYTTRNKYFKPRNRNGP